MSNRGLSANAITELGGENVVVYNLLRVDFDTPFYLTDAPHDITYDDGDGSQTYLSSADCPKFPDIKESLGIKPSTLSIDFSGALANHALLLTENYKNAEVYIHRYINGESEGVNIFKGYMDSYSTTENQQTNESKIVCKCVSHWSNWEAQNGRYINSVSQARIGFSSDKFFEFAGVTDGVLNYWGGRRTGSASDGTYARVFAFVKTFDVRSDDTYSSLGEWWTYWGVGVTGFSPFAGFKNTVYNYEGRTATDLKLPVVYGQCAVNGVPVFRALSGTDLKYLWVVYALSEGECDSLTGNKIQFGQDGIAYDDAQFNNRIDYAFYAGTDAQVTTDAPDEGSDLTNVTATKLIAAATDWTTDHDGSGVTYCIVRYEYDAKVFDSTPEPVFILKGKKCVDPNNPGNPIAFTNNSAWILYDYISNARYGKGIPVASLQAFDDGATYSATTAEPYSGGTYIPYFEFTGALDTGESIKKNAESILFSMRANLSWVGGNYKLVIDRHDTTTTVYDFTEDNITGDFSISESGIKSLLNLVEYEFTDPLLNYATDSVYADSATYLAEDNGRELRKKITNKFEQNRYRAQNRANTILKSSRENISGKLNAANADALKIECGDIIGITRATQGWTNKKFRVAGMTVSPNGDVSIDAFIEYEPSAFDWSVSTEVTLPSDTQLLNPYDTTAIAPTGATVSTATQRTATDGTTVDRGKVTWTAPTGSVYLSHYEIQFQETNDASTEWTDLPPVDADDDLFITFPAIVGVAYTARVRAVTPLNKKSAWATSSDHTITGTAIIGTDNNDIYGTDGFGNSHLYFHSFMESLDGYYSFGSVAVDSNGLSLTTSGTQGILRKNGNSNWDTFSKNRRIKFEANLSSFSTLGNTEYIWLSTGDAGSVTGDGCGFKLEWNSGTSKIDIYAWSGNGTSGELNLITSINDNTNNVSFSLKLTASTSVLLIVNGVEITNSTYIPDNDLNSAKLLIQMYAPGWGAGTSAKILFKELEILQEE